MEQQVPEQMPDPWAIDGDISAEQIAALAVAGGAFDWLAEEPDLYDETCGEPV